MRQLEQKSSRGWTGALRCAIPGAQQEAVVYLYEGGVYSTDLPWYKPRDLARLSSAGIVDNTRQAIIRSALGADVDDLDAARFCVEQGWLSPERLGTMHGEYLLASLGAVCDVAADVADEEGMTTDRYCALPVGFEDLIEALRVRQDRNAAAWSFPSAPEQSFVVRVMPEVTPAHQVPEVVAFLAALGTAAALDDVAGRCGLTRAEAAFIAASLAGQGVVDITAGALPCPSCVPEALP